MADALKAMAVSGGILMVVVFLTIGISMAAVNRGAKAMKDDSNPGGHH